MVKKAVALRIFGPNLRDQSKGQFVVHAEGCAACAKLDKLKEGSRSEAHVTQLEVSQSIWGDIIADGSMTVEHGLQEIHFCPCAKLQ